MEIITTNIDTALQQITNKLIIKYEEELSKANEIKEIESIYNKLLKIKRKEQL